MIFFQQNALILAAIIYNFLCIEQCTCEGPTQNSLDWSLTANDTKIPNPNIYVWALGTAAASIHYSRLDFHHGETIAARCTLL